MLIIKASDPAGIRWINGDLIDLSEKIKNYIKVETNLT